MQVVNNQQIDFEENFKSVKILDSTVKKIDNIKQLFP